ncbi:Zn(II)2Cys6 transcription factor [Aspergillus vadensis CBS 113365]|uniref:Zn(2)-C6 fungal-type domain-containing protein n=1 Tax=Aspergillus vadensis (strain CBS 113365 / IMI 142717 / IBT 24658) TaxID=1448311 RepID=A0A319C441_ASPVC|nr:hypothetical protein BO88DRAFT_424489 [Aspergillus vadensis CBS 113365]PYH70218.1 hypothetical protein BO88DRAFT_424489 [Aspergillus vadensis CBS 113365]
MAGQYPSSRSERKGIWHNGHPDRNGKISLKCDLCHSRKVKCDRLDPCMNCVDARAECRRTRPRRSMRPRVSRLSTLEHVISYPPSAAATSSQSYVRSQAGESNSARTDQPISSHVPETTPSQRVSESPAVSEGTPSHQELQNSNHSTPQRRTVLENALLLVNKISASSSEPKVFSGYPGCADDPDVPVREEFSLEVYLMMSMDISHQHSAQRHFYWPDHISIRCLEHMSLSLAEGTLDRQTSLHYQVCVYTKALFFLARVPQQGLGGRLRTHVKKTQERYASAALRALDQINFVALLSGALLHQMQGHPTRGWTLTAFASQILVAMNYHTITEDTPVRCQEDQDARFCLFSCFYLDKMLSMLLLRPPSLPRLKLNPASLIPMESGALSLIVKTVVELAQIQEAAMEVVHRSHGLSDISDVETPLDAAIQNLASLRAVIDERCRKSSPALQVEWIATEFRYHAIMATLLHLSPRVQAQPQAREECLVQARHAFQALGRLHKILNEEDSFVGTYSMFLSWTVFFYPTTPFYLLFCNVVGTSNTEDYQLMHETTKGLHRFIDTNPSISKLNHFFTTFLNLCSPLMQGDGSVNTMAMPLDETNLSTMPSSSEAEVSIPQIDADDYIYVSATRVGIVNDGAMDPNMISSWNNAQMWELFGAQSSLEWVDSEVSHAMPERYR